MYTEIYTKKNPTDPLCVISGDIFHTFFSKITPGLHSELTLEHHPGISPEILPLICLQSFFCNLFRSQGLLCEFLHGFL